MTAATEGRTYMIKSFQLDPDVASGKKPRSLHFPGNDYAEIETPFVVPNGKWVADLPALGWSKLVGADWSEIESVKLDTRYGGRSALYNTIYICDRPFGFIGATDGDYPVSHPKGRLLGTLRFSSARQIHKGELGRTVPALHVNYVRQPFENGQKPSVTKEHQRRRGYGWVKLTDLGEMTCCHYRPDKEVELVLDYWRFSGHRDHKNGGQLVDVAWGSSLDIELGDTEEKSLTMSQFREECDDTSEVWIRRGFAFTILRLQAMGVTPEFLQTQV